MVLLKTEKYLLETKSLWCGGNKIYHSAGLNRVRITHEDLYSLEPALKGRRFDSIFFTKSDKSGDIHKFCNSLVQKLVKANKVNLVNKEVVDLKEELKLYDKLIFPVSRILDSLGFKFILGKNIFI